jgi:glutathione S-transferase
MIIVHHLNLSRSHRIIWLLEELGLEYELKTYPRDPKTRLGPKEMYQIHPLGKFPVITDGDVTLAESGAIIEYILFKYGAGRLKPVEGSPEWVQYLYWLHFAEGSFMPIVITQLILNMVYKTSPFLIKPISAAIRAKVNKGYTTPRLTGMLNYLEATLAKNTWLTGEEFSAADINMGLSVLLSNLHKAKDADRPHLRQYVQRLEQRPAYIRTLEVAGPVFGGIWE